MLLKCYTDSAELLALLDAKSLVYVAAALLKAPGTSEKAQTVLVYAVYNVFRHADALPIGQDDVLMASVLQNGLFTLLMDIYLAQTLGDDAIVTAVEALAVAECCECFLDYVGQLLAGDDAAAFIRFYDTFVIALLDDPQERGKMLCFDDVLSWIRRERPEVEE